MEMVGDGVVVLRYEAALHLLGHFNSVCTWKEEKEEEEEEEEGKSNVMRWTCRRSALL